MKRIGMSLVLLILLLGAGLTAQATSSAWSEADATVITLSGAGAQIDGSGADADGATVTIREAGTYVLRGTLDDGQILIDAGKEDTVKLVLDGVTLHSSSTSPLYGKKADTLILVLAEGSANTITDDSAYQFEEGEDEPDAAVFSDVDLVITGTGSLHVTGSYRNGIATKDDLVVEGGQVTIEAVHDGLRGRDSIRFENGTFTITAGNDGVKSNNDGEDQGIIEILGGTLTIVAGRDGMQAESNCTITGGEIHITTGGGADGSDSVPYAADQVQNESDSQKGIKAGTGLTIVEGNITIDAADDALHSNGDLRIEGGTLTLSTGDDGAHADAALSISGGTVLILRSYEGLEGATVDISGGDITLTASDDGINAAGGNDGGEGGRFGRDTFRMGGDSRYAITISGGNLTINAQGDGIDSNGSLTISGGNILIHGPTSGGDGPLDADGEMTITGGVVIAAGSRGMAELPGYSSTQSTLAIYYSSDRAAGTVVTLHDSEGNLLATYTAEKTIQTVAFSLPELTQGEAYTVTTDGEALTVTLDSITTRVSEDGSAYAGWGFGGRGGRGGGAGMPQGDFSMTDLPEMPEDGTLPEGFAPPEGGAPGGDMPEGMVPQGGGRGPGQNGNPT